MESSSDTVIQGQPAKLLIVTRNQLGELVYVACLCLRALLKLLYA